MPKILQSASSTSAGQTSHTAAAEAMTENNSFVRSVMGDISVCPQAKQLLGQIVMDAGERWQHEEGVPAFLSDLLKDEKFVKEIMDLTGLVMAANQPDSAPPASVKDLLAPGCHAAQFQLDQLRQLLTDKLEYSYPMLDEFRSKGHNSKILHLELDSTLLQSLKAQSPDGSGSEAVTEVAEALHKAIASTLAITSADKDVQADVTSLKKALRAQTDALMKAALVLPVASGLLTPVAGKAPDPDPALIKAVAEGLHDAAKANDQAEKAFTEELGRLSPLSEGAGGAKAVAIQAGLVNKKLKLMRESLKAMEQAIQPARSRMGQLAELSKKAFRAVEKATSAESVGTLQKAMGNAWHKSPAFFRDLVRSTANQGLTLPAAIRHVAKLTTSYINRANHAVQDAARWVGDAHLSFEARLEKGAGDAVTQKINSQVRAAYHPLMVAMTKHQNASEKLIAATETLARATLTYDKSPDGVSGRMDKMAEGSVAGQHLAGGLTPGGAAKKEKSEAQLREQAQLMFNQQSEALSAARDEVEGCSEELRAVLKETAERYKQHDKQVKKLRTFKAEIDRAERHFRAAAEKMKGAVGNMANTGPGSEGAGLEEYNREIVSSQKASLRAQDSVLELDQAVQKATGKPVDVFSKDARIALHLGQYFAQMKASMQADPGFKPWLFDRMVAEVVSKEIPGHFGKKDDPDGTAMLARVMAAVVAAGNGTLLTPETIEEVMSKYPTAGEYLAKAGRSSMVGRLVCASVDMTVERLTSCLPRNLIPNLSILKAALLPLTFYQAYSSLQHAVMPGQPAPAKEAAVLGVSFLTQLTKQVADFVLPHMWKFLASAALTGYSLARDGADKFSYNLMKDMVESATFAAASRPLSEGIDIVKDAYVENKINALRMAAAGEAVAAAVGEIVAAKASAQQQTDRELQELKSYLKEKGVSDQESDDLVRQIKEGAPSEDTAKLRNKRAAGMSILTPLERQKLLNAYGKGSPKGVNIVTPFELQQTVNEKQKVTKELNYLRSQKLSLENSIKIESNSQSQGSETNVAELQKELKSITENISQKENEDSSLKEKVKSMQERLDQSAEVRRRWDPKYLEIIAQNHLNKFKDGAVIRMSGELHPETFIKNYISGVINKFPKEQRGGLDSPDSKINLRGIGSNTSGGSREITLKELAMGKVSTMDWDIKWDKNVSMDLREALNPGGSNTVPDGSGSNLGTNWYISKKVRPESLTQQIVKAFEKNLETLSKDEDKTAALVTFYDTSFKSAAINLAKKPELSEFRGQLDAIQSGKDVGEHVLFYGYVLTEVVAVRVGDNILAWDASGSHTVINNTEFGIENKQTQKWIVDHLDANAQYKYKTDESRKKAFAFYDSSTATNQRLMHQPNFKSPITTSKEDTLGKDALRVVMHRAKDDINSMVKTSGEHLLDRMIDLGFMFLGSGMAITVGGVGGAMAANGMYVMLCQIAASAGLSVTKDMLKVALADDEESRAAVLAAVEENVLNTLLVDGGLTLGIPLAKSMFPSLKLPWKAEFKDVNVMKEAMFGVAGDSIGARVGHLTSGVVGMIASAEVSGNSSEKQLEKAEAVTQPVISQQASLPPLSQTNGVSAQFYEVKEGDNIYAMSVHLGIHPSNFDLIVKANSYTLNSVFDIAPGQILIIPDSAIRPQDRIHTTVQGDTLENLSYQYYGNYNDWNLIILASIDKGLPADLRNLPPGGELSMPGSLFNGTYTVPDFTHEVKPGQTLEELGGLYYDSNVGANKLRELNPGVGDIPPAGTVLKVSKYTCPEFYKELPLNLNKGLVQGHAENSQRVSGRSAMGVSEQATNDHNLAAGRSNPAAYQVQAKGQRYIVQPGDSFHAIASAFGIRPAQYAQFIAANEYALQSVKNIKVGGELFIPDNVRYTNIHQSGENNPDPKTRTGGLQSLDDVRPVQKKSFSPNHLLNSQSYRVERGDTLESIAREFNVPATKIGLLAQANQQILLPGNNLAPGTIIIPEEARRDNPIKPETKLRIYTTKPGDSIETISYRFYGNHDNRQKIADVNPGVTINPEPGRRIILPDSRFDGNYNSDTLVHRVKAGENVQQLAQRYYGSSVGITHIMINNPDINISSELKEETVLNMVNIVEPQYSDKIEQSGLAKQSHQVSESKPAVQQGVKRADQSLQNGDASSSVESKTNNLQLNRKHIVLKGENIESVAQLYAIPYTKIGLLIQENQQHLLPGNALKQGASISIPGEARGDKHAIKPEIREREHTVKPGESYAAISYKFYGNYDHQNHILLSNADELTSNDYPQPGVTIKLPESRFNGNYAADALIHNVKEGDNIHALSVRYYGRLIDGIDIIEKNNPTIDFTVPLKEGTFLNMPGVVDPKFINDPTGDSRN